MPVAALEWQWERIVAQLQRVQGTDNRLKHERLHAITHLSDERIIMKCYAALTPKRFGCGIMPGYSSFQ
jgi:hypothetical protein